MAELPKLYTDAGPLIDLAKVKAGIAKLDDNPTVEAARRLSTLYFQKLLESARNGEIAIYTSFLTVSECTSIEKGVPVPDDDTKRFYNELLLSGGESGILTIMPTQTIITSARDLKWEQGMNLKGIDSIHVASALRLGCSELITTDGRLSRAFKRKNQSALRVIEARETNHLDSKYQEEEFPTIKAEVPARPKKVKPRRMSKVVL
jgi:predicted nucleic acid-binding protein